MLNVYLTHSNNELNPTYGDVWHTQKQHMIPSNNRTMVHWR